MESRLERLARFHQTALLVSQFFRLALQFSYIWSDEPETVRPILRQMRSILSQYELSMYDDTEDIPVAPTVIIVTAGSLEVCHES